MRIAILSCFHPFRGGIAQFNASILAELGKSCDVKAFNFTTQYPALLFPGKTQYVEAGDTAAAVESQAVLSTINPLSWRRTVKAIRQWRPDALILRYWMSWFAPSLGWVARHAGDGVKVVGLADNIIPHEPHFFDRPLTRYFLRGLDGCITLSDSVRDDLLRLRPGIPSAVLPHPVFTHFGDKMPREAAQTALGIKGEGRNLLFFGLIRKYKGLDILLKAFDSLPEDYRLIVAGEPYGDFSEYRALIDASPAKDRIYVFDRYIPDSEVKLYFSAADAVVLPYRSATQSGVGALASHFEVPMIVTDTGSLRSSIEGSGTGLAVDRAEPDCVREGIIRFFGTPGLREKCIGRIRQQNEALSWPGFCKGLTEFIQTL